MSKNFFDLAEEIGATYITQLKNNQKKLLEQVTHGCVVNKPLETFCDEYSKAHGRIEERKYEVFNASPMLDKWKDWSCISTVIKVTRTRQRMHIDENPTITDCYYICNRKLPSQKMAKYIREHWFIENKLHYVKDSTFKEDASVRVIKPFVFSYLIDFAINILKHLKNNNLRHSIYGFSLNFTKMMNMVKNWMWMDLNNL